MIEEHLLPETCDQCGSSELFTTVTPASGGYGPHLLPGLGSMLKSPKLRILLCRDCGKVRYYASGECLDRVVGSLKWHRR